MKNHTSVRKNLRICEDNRALVAKNCYSQESTKSVNIKMRIAPTWVRLDLSVLECIL